MKYAANIHYGHVVCVSRTPYLNLDNTFVYIFVVFGRHLLDHYESMIHGTLDLAIGVDIHLCSKKGSCLIS